jgi:hypothetical protein
VRRREKIYMPICLLVILALAVCGCGSVSHQAQFEPNYVPKADTRIEVGPVTNETGKAFDVDIPRCSRTRLASD